MEGESKVRQELEEVEKLLKLGGISLMKRNGKGSPRGSGGLKKEAKEEVKPQD